MRIRPEKGKENSKEIELFPSKSKRLLKALLSRRKSKKDEMLYTYLDEYWWEQNEQKSEKKAAAQNRDVVFFLFLPLFQGISAPMFLHCDYPAMLYFIIFIIYFSFL